MLASCCWVRGGLVSHAQVLLACYIVGYRVSLLSRLHKESIKNQLAALYERWSFRRSWGKVFSAAAPPRPSTLENLKGLQGPAAGP